MDVVERRRRSGMGFGGGDWGVVLRRRTWRVAARRRRGVTVTKDVGGMLEGLPDAELFLYNRDKSTRKKGYNLTFLPNLGSARVSLMHMS